MKKIILLIAICFAGFKGFTQQDIYNQIVTLLNQTYPDVKTTDKLIAINFWSVNDLNSREANKEFNKTAKIYEYAKLKGGLKGLHVLAICIDNASSESLIVFDKDGNSKLLQISNADFTKDVLKVGNQVYDSKGSLIYENLETSKIVSSINHLITR
jgi:phosphoglycerate-specific signal transduction histidine kinase